MIALNAQLDLTAQLAALKPLLASQVTNAQVILLCRSFVLEVTSVMQIRFSCQKSVNQIITARWDQAKCLPASNNMFVIGELKCKCFADQAIT